MITQHPGPLGAVIIDTLHAVFLPGETHRESVDRQVHVGDERDAPSPGLVATARTRNVIQHLLNHQRDVGACTFVVQHPYVFQADKGLEDFTRVRQDEGVFGLFSHNYN